MSPQRTIPRICEQCGASFQARPIVVSYGHARFCSHACANRSRAANQSEVERRFWARAERHSGVWWNGTECCRWQGVLDRKGYGRFTPSGQNATGAHRYSYILAHGAIPEGMHIDHLCRNHWCVNPQHLEAVTPRINILRGESLAARIHRSGHCKWGHEMTPENTYVPPSAPTTRMCRACTRRRHQERRARRGAATSAERMGA